jgi:hypothetical protein
MILINNSPENRPVYSRMWAERYDACVPSCQMAAKTLVEAAKASEAVEMGKVSPEDSNALETPCGVSQDMVAIPGTFSILAGLERRVVGVYASAQEAGAVVKELVMSGISPVVRIRN